MTVPPLFDHFHTEDDDQLRRDVEGREQRPHRSGNAGQRQRGLQHGQDGHQQQHVHPQRHGGEHPEQVVVDAHEDGDGDEENNDDAASDDDGCRSGGGGDRGNDNNDIKKLNDSQMDTD